MRWERLFHELEAQAGDLEMQDRDALVDELRDGEWAETSWRSLLGGAIVLDVIGVGRIEGVCVLVNEQVVQLRGDRAEHVISSDAVASVVSSEHRAGPSSAVSSALGWGHVFRALRAEGDSVRLQTITGSTIDGRVDVVGADFVRIREESGRDQILTFAAVAAVTGRT
ncbi:hypothetical protein J2X11_001073 [Aeromicrobium panaciterrae]|uniref:Uncharacterized protein n=1 Tax=Aeromicrobium panaciterrae TaxID=363861 RepID=A0ABU1UM18_9ACTN|nr:hypothetical protein [Aeromicrobium panaciterrae]MDR7086234.1 hypothetical protein [Aeromicrobium panaciterrae]